MRPYYFKTLVIASAFFTAAAVAHAQISLPPELEKMLPKGFLKQFQDMQQQSSIVPAAVSLSANPESPDPGATTTVTARTPLFDASSARFDWYQDGKLQKNASGIGRRVFSYVAGGVGTVAAMKVEVQSSDGKTGSATLSIRPAELTLIWNAESFVPAWYQGKVLATPNAVVRVAAIPNIITGRSAIPNDTLIYRWSVDDTENILVGVGERVMRFRTAQFPNAAHRVTLIVEDIAGTIRKSSYTFITPQSPKVLTYRVSPLGGIETRSSLTTATVAAGSVLDVKAEPFFFPVLSRKNLSFDWQLGVARPETPTEDPSTLTIRATGVAEGTFPASVRVRHDDISMPSVTHAFSIAIE